VAGPPYRVLDSDVRAVLQGDAPTDLTVSMQPYIAAAESLVDYVVAQDAANPLTANLTAAQLFTIESFVAAWAYTTGDPTYQAKTTSAGGGNASATFDGKMDMYLSSNRYGQRAIIFDTSGTLARLDKEARQGGHPKVGMLWLGRSRRTNVAGIITPNRTY
jgi:hypothetical protein